jgi:hypothetical protein
MQLKVGDELLVQGRRENILRVMNTAGLKLKAEVKFSEADLLASDTGLVRSDPAAALAPDRAEPEAPAVP